MSRSLDFHLARIPSHAFPQGCRFRQTASGLRTAYGACLGLGLCVMLGWGATGVASETDSGDVQVEYRAAGSILPAVAVSESESDRRVSETRARAGDESAGGRKLPLAADAPEEVLVRGLHATILEKLSARNSGLEALTMRDWQAFFHVSLAGTEASLPPLFGTYLITEEGLAFRPRFALRPGQTYQVTLHRARLAAVAREHPGAARPDNAEKSSAAESSAERFTFSLPSEEPDSRPLSEVAPRLLEIFPSGSVLPENQLKFYFHFATPMRRGQAYQHVRLWVEKKALGEGEAKQGEAEREVSEPLPDELAESDRWEQIEFPFLELPEELWDPDYQRFTLFFDPGRIKRGLKPREQFGPALEEGRRYVLEIDRAWKSASGEPLSDSVRKCFRVVAPDDRQPDVEAWNVVAPRVGDRWLRLEFDEPLDHAMLHRVIHVVDARGRRVEGEVTVDREETRWNFRPDQAWEDGQYAITVGTHLEDRAGNSLAKPFEVDLFDEVETRVEQSHVQLPFRVLFSAPFRP